MALILALRARRNRRNRTINIWKDPLEQYSNAELIERFRLDRQSIVNLAREIEPHLTVSTYKGRSLSSILQLVITLRYLASGDMQRTVGDSVNVSQSAVSRAVASVTRALTRIRPNYISMPRTEEETQTIMAEFFQKYSLPGIIGLIDGTHIRIQSPTENEYAFVNRKNFHSINAQMIVDSRNVIRDVVAK